MAGFGPSLNLQGAPPFALGGSAVPPPGERVPAPARSSPKARVVGDGTFRFPLSRGVGNFRKTLASFTALDENFSTRTRDALPAVLALRTFEINVPRGGEIDLFV